MGTIRLELDAVDDAEILRAEIEASLDHVHDVDPDAFQSGLDFSTRALTDADRKNITDWYEKTIGFLPNSIRFGIKHHPEFVKVNRAKWEVALKTVPKQFAPYQMLRHHTFTGTPE